MNNNDIKIKTRKKLIEVALPLDEINQHTAREKNIRHGHPSTMHLWWARRPLAAARAVIFSQMVDDPSEHPEEFPTEDAQSKERQRLFGLIKQLVRWENTNNEEVLRQTRNEIWKTWRFTCDDNKDHPRSAELFNPEKLPAFYDPFAGGGALPLEAQRLGLESHASDLNPVAVLINKALIEIPPKFAGQPPVNPAVHKGNSLFKKEWRGVQGLVEDILYYGRWMRDEAEKRIGYLYPEIEVNSEIAAERLDLKQYVGQKLTVIAWMWARTVICPNPACRLETPLLSSFQIAKTPKRSQWLKPITHLGRIRFEIVNSPPPGFKEPVKGYKRGRSGIFECAFCKTITTRDYVAQQSTTQGLGSMPVSIVVQGRGERLYLDSSASSVPCNLPDVNTSGLEVELSPNPRDVWCRNFGLNTPKDLFTKRQLVALTTFSDLIGEMREQVIRDALDSGASNDTTRLSSGGTGITAYADVLSTYLAFAVDKTVDYNSSLCGWSATRETIRNTFGRQAIPMVWDYCESNIIGHATGSFESGLTQVSKVVNLMIINNDGYATQGSAQNSPINDRVVSTDPPYYDNMAYADLSDFFYVWLRRSLRTIFPSLFETLAVPKLEELVALPYRHGGKQKADAFFLDGMTQSIHQLASQAHPGYPVTIYYAFKQTETKSDTGVISTGWQTFLKALIQAGFAITGTWPLRTEMGNRMISAGTNALASSVVLVCRPQDSGLPTATRSEFAALLRDELPEAVDQLQSANIAPVDLTQASIGPGMAIFTRYARVLDASGKAMTVQDALLLINQTLSEVMTEQEDDSDADSQWAMTWFEQQGFSEGDFGVAETLSRSRDTSIDGMVQAGILLSGSGKVRLLRPNELPEDWDPTTDTRIPIWEALHHLVRALESGGEPVAAELMSKLGAGMSEVARELAYRLYTICERKNWAREALSYNALVQSWPEISRLARQEPLDQQSSFL